MAPPPTLSDDALVNLAHRLITDHGMDALTMDRLAETAGISRMTLYRRLGPREAILRRLRDEGRLPADEVSGLDTRDRILAAARQLFLAQHALSASMEEIARQAGVGTATVYRQFGDREGLLNAFLEHTRVNRWRAGSLPEPTGDFLTDLHALMAGVIRGLQSEGDLHLLLFAEARRNPELALKSRAAPERSIRLVESLLQSGIDQGLLQPLPASELAAILAGLVLTRTVLGPFFNQDPNQDPDLLARTVVHVFLNGVRIPPLSTGAQP